MIKVKKFKKNIFMTSVGAIILVSFWGCEATRGLGKDIENTGKNIQKALNKIDGSSNATKNSS